MTLAIIIGLAVLAVLVYYYSSKKDVPAGVVNTNQESSPYKVETPSVDAATVGLVQAVAPEVVAPVVEEAVAEKPKRKPAARTAAPKKTAAKKTAVAKKPAAKKKSA